MKFERLDFARIDWQSVLPRFGVDSALIANPKRLGPCPIENEGKTRFRFVNSDGRGGWFCNNCKGGDGIRLVALVNGISDTEAIRLIKGLDSSGEVTRLPVPIRPSVEKTKDVQKVRAGLQRVWDQSQPVGKTFVEKYIERRVPLFDMSWLSGSIKAHASLYHFDEGTKKTSRRPAMVARVVGLDGTPVTLHRTYLSVDGYKSAVTPDQVKKQMTGVTMLNGAAIRLNVPRLQSRTLIVCEGIETGLSLVAATGNRHEVWAALNAGNLAKLQVPRERFDSVLICADKDVMNKLNGWRQGEHSAEILHQRLLSEGFKSKVKVPQTEGLDYADLWLERCTKLRLVA